MAEEILKKEEKNGVLILTLNRSRDGNSLNFELLQKIATDVKFGEIERRVNAIILTAAGDHFCVGFDNRALTGILSKHENQSTREFRSLLVDLQHCLNIIEGVEKPVIAVVQGIVGGAGFELALACDFIVAEVNTVFSLWQTQIGLIPDLGGITRLVRGVGLRRAKEIILTAREIELEEANEFGLINKIAPKGKGVEVGLELARTLLANAPLAVGLAKRLIEKSLYMDKYSSMELEILAQSNLITSLDFREGLAARIRGTTPHFKGI